MARKRRSKTRAVSRPRSYRRARGSYRGFGSLETVSEGLAGFDATRWLAFKNLLPLAIPVLLKAGVKLHPAIWMVAGVVAGSEALFGAGVTGLGVRMLSDKGATLPNVYQGVNEVAGLEGVDDLSTASEGLSGYGQSEVYL